VPCSYRLLNLSRSVPLLILEREGILKRRPSSRLRTTSAPTNRRAPYGWTIASIHRSTPSNAGWYFPLAMEGDILTFLHHLIKQSWVRRNGLPESDKATLVRTLHSSTFSSRRSSRTSYRDRSCLSPEPLNQVPGFHPESALNGNWLWPCEYVWKVATREKGAVPNFCPAPTVQPGVSR